MLVTIAAYAEASGQPYLLKPIEESIQYCALAGQLYDDILDWQEDRLNGHITWVLLELMRGGDRNAESDFPSLTSGDNQVRGWKDLVILNDVVNRFSQAEEAIKELNCPGWKRFLSGYRELVLKEQRASAARHLRNLLSPVIGEKASITTNKSYSPVGTQIFFTCVASCRNSCPAPCSRTHPVALQAVADPGALHVRRRFVFDMVAALGRAKVPDCHPHPRAGSGS